MTQLLIIKFLLLLRNNSVRCSCISMKQQCLQQTAVSLNLNIDIDTSINQRIGIYTQPPLVIDSLVSDRSLSGGSMLGQGARAPNLAQAPKFLIGSTVISLSRCCLSNDKRPATPLPQYFFLEPPLRSLPKFWSCGGRKSPFPLTRHIAYIQQLVATTLAVIVVLWPD